MRLSRLFAGVCGLLLLPVSAQVPKLLWLDEAMPANQVLNINGSTMQLLLPNMADIQIESAKVNSARALALLKSNPNACVGNKLLTAERQAISYHTQLPQVVFPGLQLFALRDSPSATVLNELRSDNGIRLADVLAHQQRLRLAVAGDRHYSTEIDGLLQSPSWQRQLWRRHGADDTPGVLKMLREGRIDLVIEYPNVFSHYQGPSDQQSPYISVPIIESAPILAGYILCSRTAEGAELIARFDTLLAQISQNPRYLQAHLRWFEPQTHATVIELYNQVYQTNFK